MEKDFWEIHDSLPMDQRQQFLDHMVCTILGKPTAPLIFTKSVTISNDLALEERIRLTALSYNIDPSQIDQEDFVRGEKEMAESKVAIKAIIKDYFGKESLNGQRSKNDEILSAGKFLFTTGLAEDMVPAEEPDFVLNSQSDKIGMEHTRLEAGPDKAYVAELWKKYLKGALTLVLEHVPTLLGVANITLDTDVRIFSGKCLRDFKSKEIKNSIGLIHQQLSDCILRTISGEHVKFPLFVKTLTYHTSLEPFTLKCNQEYFARNDFNEMLVNSIRKKEKRLLAYKQNKSFKSWWLLIVYSEGGYSSAFKIDGKSLPEPVSTMFDRVFILNSFNLACYELIAEKPYLKYIATKQFSEPRIKNG